MQIVRARSLRRNATEAEQRLWYLLRGGRLAGYKFRRQHPIRLYIVDFACVPCRLAVEVDGGQHSENAADERRTGWLRSEGWRVVRFWNHDIVAQPGDVVEAIRRALEGR